MNRLELLKELQSLRSPQDPSNDMQSEIDSEMESLSPSPVMDQQEMSMPDEAALESMSVQTPQPSLMDSFSSMGAEDVSNNIKQTLIPQRQGVRIPRSMEKTPEQDAMLSTVSDANPFEKVLQEGQAQQSLADRMRAAQDRQSQELRNLALLQYGQMDFKNAGKSMRDAASTIVPSEKNKIAMEGEEKSRDFLRKALEKQMPGLEVPEGTPAATMQKLLSIKSKQSGATPQQSGYIDKISGDPVYFDRAKQKYVNAITQEEVTDTGSLARNYQKTFTHPRTGDTYRTNLDGTITLISKGPGSTNEPSSTSLDKEDDKPRDIKWQDLNPNQRKAFDKIEDDYRKDVADSVEFAETLASVSDLVDSDISAAIPAIKRQLARSVGKEVGVMTDADVAAFSGDQSFLGAMERFAKLQATGKMTEEDKNQYKGIIEIATKRLNDAMKNRANYHVERFRQRVPMASEFSVKNLMGIEASKPDLLQGKKPTPEGKVRVVTEDGTPGFIDKDKVEAFKKKYPNAKVGE